MAGVMGKIDILGERYIIEEIIDEYVHPFEKGRKSLWWWWIPWYENRWAVRLL